MFKDVSIIYQSVRQCTSVSLTFRKDQRRRKSEVIERIFINGAVNYHDSPRINATSRAKCHGDNTKRSKTADAPRPSAGWRVLKKLGRLSFAIDFPFSIFLNNNSEADN